MLIYLTRMLFRLRNSKLASLIFKRSIKTTPKLRGSHSPAAAPSTENPNWFKSLCMVAENPKIGQGYLYREAGNLQGGTQATVAKITISLVWYWIFYNLYHHPENLFGHADYPDTAKWTDKELGIPADDEE